METQFQPRDIRLAKTFFTPAVKEQYLRQASIPLGAGGRPKRWPFFASVYRRHLTAPETYNIGADDWRAAWPDAPPLPYKGPCPFCGEPFEGVTANMDAKHSGQMKCCGHVICSHASDIPPDVTRKPDAEVTVPFRNRTPDTYHAYTTESGALFVPAFALAADIHSTTSKNLAPALVYRVVTENDAAAARRLAIILDCMGQTGTTFPYVTRDGQPSFARYRDLGGMLPPSRKSFAKTFADRQQDAFISTDDYRQLIAHLSSGPISPVRSRKQAFVPAFEACGSYGMLAEAWGVIAHHPAVAALSRARYGNAHTLADNTMLMLQELNAYERFTYCPGGNFAIGWIPFHATLATVCQDQDHARMVVNRIESFLVNHHFSEGISHEGAFNYAAMMGACFEPWVCRELFGVDFNKIYPRQKLLHRLGDYPVRALTNIESQHADEHTAFFASTRLQPAAAFDYTSHERSQCFTQYGLTCLRAGVPGSRMELIMSHQNPTMHTDPDRLGLQLFYEGVNLLPEIGYMTYDVNMQDVSNRVAESELRITQVSEKRRFGYNDTIENHCTAAINGNQFGLRGTTFERYFGGVAADDPRWLVQFVQVDGRPVFAEHIDPVAVYNRQLATINLPGGRPVVFDVFRIKGGRRHDLFWHVPATAPTTDLGMPTPVSEANLHQYYTNYAEPKPGWQQEEDPFSYFYKDRGWRYKDDTLERLTKPTEWTPADGKTWHTAWTVDPERYAPKLKSGTNQEWQRWSRLLQPIRLNIWGELGGGKAKEKILGAVGPWCSLLPGFGALQFEEAFSYWIEHRQGTRNLESSFVHVIEPHTLDQDSAIESVEVMETDGIEGRGARIKTKNNDNVYVAGTLHGEVFKNDDLELHGRLGVLMPSADAAFLYDGTSISNATMAVQLDDSWKLELTGIRGDLTGHPDESALFVKSDRPLPTGGILNGTTLTVRHQTNPAHSTGYRIAKVTAVGDDAYRIDLANIPGFIQYKYRVEEWDAETPQTVVADKLNLVSPNQPYLIGRRMRFPESGFETSVSGTAALGWRAYHHRTWYLKEPPAPGQIRVGAPMIVYAIQPGDTVEIPSFFACRVADEGSILHIATSGRAILERRDGSMAYRFSFGPGMHKQKLPRR